MLMGWGGGGGRVYICEHVFGVTSEKSGIPWSILIGEVFA